MHPVHSWGKYSKLAPFKVQLILNGVKASKTCSEIPEIFLLGQEVMML